MTTAHKKGTMTTLSYSEAATFLRCPRKYKHRAIDSIQKVGYFKPAIYRGSHFHELMKRYHLGEDFIQYHIDTIAAVEQDEDRFAELRGERLDELELAFGIFNRYIEQYADELGEIEVLNVEEEFVVETTDLTFTTTPDLVYRDPHGLLWVRDYKTVGSIPEEFPFGDLQPIFTTTAVAAVYNEPVNFEYHYIRAKLPTEPRLNKTGPKKVNNLNRIDTTFEVLRDFLADEAPDLLTDEEHKARLAELREHDRFFKRITFYGTPDQLGRNIDLMSDIGTKVCDAQDQEFFPMVPVHVGVGSCGSCEFKDLCTAEFYGYNVEAVLRDEYEPRAEKNPYEEDHDDTE